MKITGRIDDNGEYIEFTLRPGCTNNFIVGLTKSLLCVPSKSTCCSRDGKYLKSLVDRIEETVKEFETEKE